jgi:hypothetical protein
MSADQKQKKMTNKLFNKTYKYDNPIKVEITFGMVPENLLLNAFLCNAYIKHANCVILTLRTIQNIFDREMAMLERKKRKKQVHHTRIFSGKS